MSSPALRELEAPANRAERRLMGRQARRDQSLAAALEDANKRMISGNRKRNEQVELTPKKPGLFYAGMNQLPYLRAMRDLSRALSGIEERNFKDPKVYHGLLRNNFYALRVHGTSLEDIEGLDSPLDPDSIRRVNRMLERQWFSPVSPNQQAVTEMISVLAIQPKALPDVVVPVNLRPLAQRVEAYMQYCSPFLVEPVIEFGKEFDFVWSILKRGKNVIQTLFSQLPAFYGLIPQSVYEAYRTKSVFSDLSTCWKMLDFGKDVSTALTGAYVPGALSNGMLDLEDFKGPTEITRHLLADRYKEESVDYSSQQRFLETMRGFRKALREQILSSRMGALQLTPGENHPFLSRLYVLAYGKKSGSYRDTLVLVGQHKTTGEQIVMEVNNSQRVWGIPAEIYRSNPHGAIAFGNHTLEPLLSYAKKHFSSQQTDLSAREPFIIKSLKPPPVPQNLPGEKKRRWVVASVAARVFQKDEPIPESIEQTGPKVSIGEYNEGLVGELLGTKDKKVIRRFMYAISRFEQTGQGGVKRIEAGKKHGIEVFAQRVGHNRIIYSRDAQGILVLVKILKRSDYDDKTLEELVKLLS